MNKSSVAPLKKHFILQLPISVESYCWTSYQSRLHHFPASTTAHVLYITLSKLSLSDQHSCFMIGISSVQEFSLNCVFPEWCFSSSFKFVAEKCWNNTFQWVTNASLNILSLCHSHITFLPTLSILKDKRYSYHWT